MYLNGQYLNLTKHQILRIIITSDIIYSVLKHLTSEREILSMTIIISKTIIEIEISVCLPCSFMIIILIK